MVEWVSEKQAEDLNLVRATPVKERCVFCSKEFDTHNAFTAHLRWHSGQIDDMVYEVINKSSKPIRVATIQNLANVNFSIKNAVQRLVRSGKIHHVREGFATRIVSPVKTTATTFDIPARTATTALATALSEEQMNKLIVSTIKSSHPEVYNSIIEQIVSNMVRYAVGMAEIS